MSRRDATSQRRTNCRGLALAGAILLIAAAARAETWLEPKVFLTHATATMDVDLREGAPWSGPAMPRLREREVSFTRSGPDGREPVGGGDGREPAGVVRLEAPGLHVVAVHLEPELLVIPADDFDLRLAASGHEDLLLARAESFDDGRDCRVRISRSARTLISVEGGPEGGRDQPAGLPLELVLLDDTREAPGHGSLPGRGTLRMRVLHAGHALPGALVSARSADRPDELIEAIADSSGIATLPRGDVGRWLAAAVHVEAIDSIDADDEAEWSLLETTLVFEVRDEAASPAPSRAHPTVNP